jgi:Uncharacterised protein family (UPF0158)
MSKKLKQEAQNPLILRCHRLMEAFGKSDDERDFYLDRLEGFIIYVDLDKSQPELELLEKELKENGGRYCLLPKLTFYETKKIMEGFVNEKVYDIDTKEKLLDIIQSKEARENFLEFIYDHHAELEKWQQFYQERSRIRIIEWLRSNQFTFVFEEDLDLPKTLIEKLKSDLFQVKANKEVLAARKVLHTKAKAYYSTEALNPRPKRGRPPKQAAKQEIEHHTSTDVYTTVPPMISPFLYIPGYSSSSINFSSKFENEEDMIASRRSALSAIPDLSIENLNQKLAALRHLSHQWQKEDGKTTVPDVEKKFNPKPDAPEDDETDSEEEEVEGEDFPEVQINKKKSKSATVQAPKDHKQIKSDKTKKTGNAPPKKKKSR